MIRGEHAVYLTLAAFSVAGCVGGGFEAVDDAAIADRAADAPPEDDGSRDGGSPDGPEDQRVSDRALCGDAICSAGKVCSVEHQCVPRGWETVPFEPGSGDLTAVGGTSAIDLWVLSANNPYHHDGTGWTKGSFTLFRRIYSLWATARDNVWGVGDQGYIVHYDGEGWTKQLNPVSTGPGVQLSLHGVWGGGPTDVWAVGEGNAILHYDGDGWTAVSSPASPGAELRDIHGCSSSSIWAVGSSGTLIHYDGSTWTTVETPAPSALGAVWCREPDEVWIAGQNIILRRKAGAWTEWPMVGAWRDIAGLSAEDVWAVGLSARMVYFDGHSWAPITSPAGQTDLYSMWANPDGDLWAVGQSHTVIRLQGRQDD